MTKPIFEMHEFPEAFACLGNDVSFVHFPEGNLMPSIERKGRVDTIKGRVEEQSAIRLITPRALGGSIAGRLLHAITFYFQFTRILREIDPEIVVSYSVPTSGWQALIACKKRNIPYIYRALDASPEIRKTIFAPLVKAAEKYICRNADWVSANNPSMLERVILYGASSKRASVEYPPVDIGRFETDGTAKNVVKSKLGLKPDSRVVLFMGSFFYFSGLPEVIRSFRKLRHVNDYLVLIGMGEQDKTLRSLVKSSQLEEVVVFTGQIEFSDLPGYLSIGDVAINPFVPSEVSNVALPNKILQYMATGLPVVTTRLDGLVSVFGDKRSGLIFVEKPELVMSAAMELLSEKEKLSERGAENAILIREKFSKKIALGMLADRIRSVQETYN